MEGRLVPHGYLLLDEHSDTDGKNNKNIRDCRTSTIMGNYTEIIAQSFA